MAGAGSSRGPQWVVAHHRDLLLGLTCRWQSAPLLAPLAGLLCSPSPCSSPLSKRFCPQAHLALFLGKLDLHSLANADREDLGTLQHDLDVAPAEALADKPPVDHHLYNFDLVCSRFLQTRLVLFGTPPSARTPTSSLTWLSSLLTSFCCVSSVPPQLSCFCRTR